ncbi:ATP-binding protein [Actinophytocola sp.]|uniref:ATP-binding protein n=1 Tax=Actinophytocola sp. TaxID=1872138 RepID=UPI00389A4DDB
MPRQLPPDPAHFTNRSAELRALDDLVPAGDAGRPRLVVLTGPGGAGKTAVALRWVHANADRFPGGQLYADLGALSPRGPVTASEVLSGFLRALGVPPDDIPIDLREQSALYRSVSVDRSVAVVADDADSVAQVRPLLPASPRSVLVVTSRWRLAGLALDGARFVDIDMLDEQSALELLSLVAGPGKVDLEPTPARQLVRLCGGLPMALRLAAAQLSTRPRWSISRVVGTLADEQHRLSALAISGEVSMRSNLDLSYRELPGDVARLYRLLGLHPGPEFGIGVVAAAGDVSPEVAERLVADLVDAIMLYEVDVDRFRFHDLLRLHAAERALEHDETAERDAAVRRMVEWYLDNAIAADLAVMPRRYRAGDRYDRVGEREPVFPTAAAALDWLERELPNLLTAQRCAADRARPDLAWQLCEALWSLFLYRKHFTHWITAHELGIAAAAACGHQVAQALLVVHLGIAYLNLRRYDLAHRRFAEALALSATAGDLRIEATALEHLGLVARRTERPQEAMSYFERALASTERLGEQRGTALHLRRIGETLAEVGRRQEALTYLRRAVTAATDLDDVVLRGMALIRLGAVHTQLDQHADALVALSDAAEILAGAGSHHYHGLAVEALAELHLRTGDLAAARQHLLRAVDLYRHAELPRAAQVQARLDSLTGGLDHAGEE